MFVIHDWQRNYSEREDLSMTSSSSHKNEIQVEELILKGNTTPTSKISAYKGALSSKRENGHVASVSISKLRGKHVERDTVCSDEFPIDDTTLRVLKKIRSEASGQKIPTAVNEKLPRVLCMVYTSQVHHSSKLNAVVNTWAKECDGFFAASNLTDPFLGATDLMHNGPEEYSNMWQKIRSMWAYVHAHYIDEYDFFHICGDDVYLFVENLRQLFLSLHLDKSKPLFLGTPMRHKGSFFAAGGPGYIPSIERL